MRNARVKPFEVFGILNRNVSVLNDNHKDVLYDGNHEEDEDVHEEVCIIKVGKSHGMEGVEKSISCLH